MHLSKFCANEDQVNQSELKLISLYLKKHYERFPIVGLGTETPLNGKFLHICENAYCLLKHIRNAVLEIAFRCIEITLRTTSLARDVYPLNPAIDSVRTCPP